jgi:WD40 repeat protein
VLNALEIPARYVFGRDVFISYSRADASKYAPNLVLALQAKRPRLSFYLDRWIAPPSGDLPRSLERQLRWSSLLVVICTENAVQSQFVKEEIRLFGGLGRKVVPVDVGGRFSTLDQEQDIWRMIGGASAEPETEEALDAGAPSDHVIERILKSIEFTVQDQRLRRSVYSTVGLTTAIVGGALLYSQQIVRKANDSATAAEARAAQANLEAARADELRDQAQKEASSQQKRAAEATNEAGRQQEAAKRASLEAALARQSRDEAQAETKTQQELAAKANQEAKRQQEIATIRRLANESEADRTRGPDLFVRSISLAVEAARRADSLGMQMVEADSALRSSLGLLPASRSRIELAGGYLRNNLMQETVALSSDAQQLGLLTRDPKTDREMLLIQRTSDRKEIFRGPCDGCTGVALNRDASRVALSFDSGVRVKTVDGSREWDIVLEHDPMLWAFAFSPNGRYVAVAFSNELSVRLRSTGGDLYDSTLELWDVEGKRRVGSFSVGGSHLLQIESVAFSARGRRLAAGGLAANPFSSDTGEAYVWEIPDQEITGNGLKHPEQFVPQNQIHRLTISDSGRFLATAPWQVAPGTYTTVQVWQHIKRGEFQELTRVPLSEQTYRLGFSSDERMLFTLSGTEGGASQSGGTTMEAWDVSGYREVSKATGTSARESARFPSAPGPVFGPGKTTRRQAAGNFKVDKNKVFNALSGVDVAPQEIRDLTNVFDSELSADGRFLAITLQDGEEDVTESGPFQVVVWDLEQGKRLSTVRCHAWIRLSEFSPASKFLAVGDKSGFVQILNVHQGTIHSAQRSLKITALAFSPTDDYLAIGDAQGLVSVLKTIDFEDIVHLQHGGEVASLSFSTDVRYLAVSDIEDDRSDNGQPASQEVVRIWQLRTSDFLDEACRRLSRFRSGATGCADSILSRTSQTVR